jgi:mono/diheme cytochrome c family protein
LLRSAAGAALLILGLAAATAGWARALDEHAAAGQRLYREGRLASGQAITALVQGDVPLRGTQVTCGNCHGRSGLGVIEGGRISAPIAGPLLFAPDPVRKRPAYDVASLARALREGLDSRGRPIDPLMPRFRLGDADVANLAAYLRTLSAAPSPGVGPDHLELATIIAGDVDQERERAVLDVLEAFVAARNTSGRQRIRGGHFPKQWKETYRKWSLDVWRLRGRPQTWREQLEAHYRKRPVFAVVGGLGEGSWQPVHDFCESMRMPCLLPDIALPPAGAQGFYSLYYSGGVRQEAAVLAAALAAKGVRGEVASVVEGERGSASREAAAELGRALAKRGMRMRVLDARDSGVLAKRARDAAAGPLVLWLGPQGLRRVAAEIGADAAVPQLWLSATLLDGRWSDLPAGLRARSRLVTLSAPAGKRDASVQRFRVWARLRGVRVRDERHQALAYFAFLTMADGVIHVQQYVIREYVMDMLEHASTLTAFLPYYRRAEMTPGQRVLSRGGYVLDPSGSAAPRWIVP